MAVAGRAAVRETTRDALSGAPLDRRTLVFTLARPGSPAAAARAALPEPSPLAALQSM